MHVRYKAGEPYIFELPTKCPYEVSICPSRPEVTIIIALYSSDCTYCKYHKGRVKGIESNFVLCSYIPKPKRNKLNWRTDQ